MGRARGGTKEDEVAHERKARMTGAPRKNPTKANLYTLDQRRETAGTRGWGASFYRERIRSEVQNRE